MLSDRVKKLNPSPTLVVTQRAAELRAAGKDIIGLGAGEPDFDTPEHIKQAAKDALDRGETKYTAVDGTPALKDAIIKKFEQDNGLHYKPDQILVSVGGKQSFFNLCLALLNPGDEVIIPAPYWVSYPEIVGVAEGVPIILKAEIEQRYKLAPSQLANAITPKTRMLVLNSPSNPTGVAYTQDELKEFGEVLRGHPGVIIATDDMYEHILWADEPFSNIAMACPDLAERCMVLNGVSKAYAMTGWRIGYAGGPAELIKAMKKIQGQSTTNPASVSQAAALAALDSDQQCVKEMCAAYKQRHDYVFETLNTIDGLSAIPSDGTFYSFPDARDAIAKLGCDNDIAFAEVLLDKAGVAIVPGSAFGAEGHFRLSFATSKENLVAALGRIAEVLKG